jgi:lysylphosphatidylglycerol synthetase-like protein (DUF2156 family)
LPKVLKKSSGRQFAGAIHMENISGYTVKEERKGFAIAALIIGFCALICSFLYGWRIFSMIIAIPGLIAGIISYRKALLTGKGRAKQITAIAFCILSILLSAYFLYSGPAEKHILEGDKMPHKVNEKGLPGSVDPNLPVK